VSSPANRAISTATYFAEAYDKKAKHVLTFRDLYEPSLESFYEVVEKLDDDVKTVAIFSHNPGITAFANKLTSVTLDDMPTCAVFALKADIKKWKDFTTGEREFLFFDYPKAE
jgi:phosphohistidine phosphatase